MAKNLVLSAGGKTVVLPLKSLVAVEVSLAVATVAVATAVGAVVGHPVVGFAVGFGLVAVKEVVEYVVAARAVKSGKLTISTQ
jgi:hypothetical protein